MKNQQMYIGEVFNRFENRVTNYTKKHTTWESAHHAAEKLAKRIGMYSMGHISIKVRPE